ncbi:SARP family transcriptional regulator [Rhodococcus sp. IEGM 248]|nr:SARP family transcriptional regulator [Rhodococcus sp. IEGM 248]
MVDTGTRRVHLLAGPEVSISTVRRPIPDGSKRLVALLALDPRPADRRFLAGALWPDTDDAHAAGCLRTALWRLRQAGLDLFIVDKSTVRLRPDIVVDVHEVLAWASRVIDGCMRPSDLDAPRRRADALDLLPGWYDEWVAPHRERLRQRMLHALDGVSAELSGAGRHADAVDAAQLSVSCDPLRESGQRALIRAHLREGNAAEARRAFARFAWVLERELGLLPSEELAALAGAPSPRALAEAPSAVALEGAPSAVQLAGAPRSTS